MVLVVTPGDRHPRPLAPLLLGGGIGVGAREGDGGGVVVQFIEVDLELSDDMGHEHQDQRGDVALEQAIETTAGAVVVECGELAVGQAQCLGDEHAAHSPTP